MKIGASKFSRFKKTAKEGAVYESLVVQVFVFFVHCFILLLLLLCVFVCCCRLVVFMLIKLREYFNIAVLIMHVHFNDEFVHAPLHEA